MKKNALIILILNLITTFAFTQPIRYVKPGGTGNGSSWANASGNIQDMIDYSNSGDQVWIAGGTYLLATTITMRNGVSVYGGFFGNETTISARPKSDLDGNGTIEPWEFTHATVLNGQNARRVINQGTIFTMETVWDGLSITNGKITSGYGAGIVLGTNSKLTNSVVSNNSSANNSDMFFGGGGIYNAGGNVSHCLIHSNSVTNWQYPRGGGIYSIGGIVSYCTISNNTVSSTGSPSSGGGVYVENGVMSNCNVLSNSASGSYLGYGGGIYISNSAISDCMIVGNTSSLGGGIYCIVSATINNCTINGNTASGWGGNNHILGGGICYSNNATGTLSNCTISGNTASITNVSSGFTALGGGVYGNAEVTIMDCILDDNKTMVDGVIAGRGGGIYQGIITRCRIENNTSGEGGGFYGSSANHCLILNNSATTNGGGGFVVSNDKNINCTFVGNTANNSGGGAYYSTLSGTKAANCIFWQNNAPTWPQIGTPTGSNPANITYSAVQDGYTGTGNITIAAENETGGPKFLNPLTHNYQLQACSPCINAGNNGELTAAADTTDLAGNTRIYGGTVDLGAYERQSANPPTYTISGIVTYNGNPLSGVTISSSGGTSVTTNTSGAYSFSVCQDVTVTITPSLSGYFFTPENIVCSNITSNLPNQNFIAQIPFVPVTNITGVPTTATATLQLTLTGTVAPSNATNNTITWSIQSAGTTGATISGGNMLNTTSDGTCVVLATIVNGASPTTNYTLPCSITVSKAALTGTPTVSGNAVFGQTLTAVTTGLGSLPAIPNLGTFSYQWRRGTTNISGATSSTYQLVQADIGQQINVQVSAANCTGIQTSANTATVTKATQTTPAAPTMASNNSNSITLVSVTGCEYNRNGGTFQDSPLFSGLTPNTSYPFTQRIKETATHFASPASPVANFSTTDIDFVPVTDITGVPTTATTTLQLTLTGTVVPSNATNKTITWSIQSAGTTGATISGGNMLNTTSDGTCVVLATIVNGASPTTNYTLPCSITVSKAALTGTPTITGNAVFGQTLTAITTGLGSSPAIPNLGTFSYQWRRGITNISDATSSTYSLVQADIGQQINVQVSAANCTGTQTSANTATVTKATQTAPNAPTLANSTMESITLNTVSGCEYNINGGEWKVSPVFEGLSAGTSYSFTQRLAETETHSASPESPASVFTTSLSINENLFENIKIYPNPTTGELTIDNEQLTINIVEVFDMLGRNHLSIINCPLSIEINISHLQNGLYFVRIQTESGEVLKKVLKK